MSDTTSDNEQLRVTTNGKRETTNRNERKRVTANDNEWQWVVISANFPFLQIREEPTTMHTTDY